MGISFNINSKVNKNGKNGNAYSFKGLIVFALLVASVIIEIKSYGSGTYLDEAIGILSAAFLITSAQKIERRDFITVLILFVVVIIGIISNLISELNNSWFSIGIDIVSSTKVLLSYFAVKYFLSTEEKQRVIDMLLPLARLFIILAFIFSLINLVTDIGMAGDVRYGIRSFRFIFKFNFQYVAVYMLFFGVIVCNTKMGERKRKTYYYMAIISLVLATKAPAIIFSIVFLFLYYYFKKYDRISIPVIIVGVLAIIAVGWYQIDAYLLNESAPRHLFTKYAIRTANDYFPLGSGFATFGSDQAAKIYSPLYYLYGFNTRWGMTPDDSAFLRDNFWQMAVGQFGWFGGLAYMAVFVRAFLTMKSSKLESSRRAFLYAAYLQYMIHAVGSAILSSSAGMIGFMAIALFTLDTEKLTQERRLRVRI